MRHGSGRPLAAVAVAALLLGCGSNIKHISAPAAPVSTSMVFDGSMEKVWGATQSALSDDATFKVLDKSSGIMITELRTIEGSELSLLKTYFLGKTYKSSYTINFRAVGSAKTEVKANVNLQTVQLVLLSREEDLPEVKSYMRQKLFDKISANLKR